MGMLARRNRIFPRSKRNFTMHDLFPRHFEKRFGKPFLEIFKKSFDFHNPSLGGADCVCQYSIICNYVWYYQQDEYDFSYFYISIFYTLRPFSNAKNLNLQTKLSTLIRDIAKKNKLKILFRIELFFQGSCFNFSSLALHINFELPFKGIYCWQLPYIKRRIIPVLKS